MGTNQQELDKAVKGWMHFSVVGDLTGLRRKQYLRYGMMWFVLVMLFAVSAAGWLYTKQNSSIHSLFSVSTTVLAIINIIYAIYVRATGKMSYVILQEEEMQARRNQAAASTTSGSEKIDSDD